MQMHLFEVRPVEPVFISKKLLPASVKKRKDRGLSIPKPTL